MPGDVDVSRLVLQVDASIELARRNLRDLTTAVTSETANWDKALDRSGQSFDRIGKKVASVGQFRGGMQQLSFQIGDVSQQMALGTKASTIFAQQSGQVIQALQLMNTGSSGFLKFLAGPWGVVLTTAGIILATFAGKLFETGDETGKLIDKMKDQARQAELNSRAEDIYKKSLEGTTEAIRKRREEQEKSLRTDIQAEQQALDGAKAERARAEAFLARKRAELPDAEADLAKQKSAPQLAGPGGQAQEQRVVAAQQRVDQLKHDIADLERKLAEAEANVRGAEIPIAERSVDDRLDKVKAATDAYTVALGNLRKQLQGGQIDQARFEAELEKAAKKRDAAIKAAEEEKKSARAGSGGTEIANAQTAQFYDTAAKYRGMSERSDKGVLEAFFREANLKLDPEKTAWCAAFVNAVLATNGVTGTGSLAARSFLNFGKDDTRSPQKGDIAVVSKSGQDHVGFVESVDKAGNVKVFGGNTADKVGTSTYTKNQVLAIRRPPSPAESADLAQRAADKATDQDDAFASQMSAPRCGDPPRPRATRAGDRGSGQVRRGRGRRRREGIRARRPTRGRRRSPPRGASGSS
jgi:uncharacterized protein (TIGR02594 family)